MEPDYIEALRYLSSPAGSFWKWDEQGAIVVWSSGSTLAFREELTIMLERLAPTGLPALDSVLLLIAAMREYWPEDSLPLQHRLRTRDAVDQAADSFNTFCSTLFQRLEVIHELPDELIRSTHKKAELAAIVFERAPRTAVSNVATVVVEILSKRLNGALPNLSKLRGGRVQTSKALIHDLFPLCDGLKGISKESLQLRHKTGLDVEPEPAVIDHSVSQPMIHGLLQELIRDSELAGLARLARNLAAVVQLPRSISESDELPLGGVSDLTNRGSLDRLLLSELAHDDLMLATRVALNEALYLRREIPPSFPPRRCHVLVDAGLRMWGVPRVYSTAFVLSLAASGERETTLAAYRAAGSEIVSIDLSTRDGLIEHLGTLEPDAHPGQALEEFFGRVEQCNSPSDVVLVTTESVLKDAAFQQRLDDAGVFPLFVATVNRDGDFQLWGYGSYGRKCHSTLHLDLDQILNQAKPEVPKLIDKTFDPNLPAIFRIKPFPFRLPYLIRDLTKEVMWSVPLTKYREHLKKLDSSHDPIGSKQSDVDHGVMIVTRERQLLFFDDSGRGAKSIAEQVPFGKCLHAWPSDDELTMHAVIHREAESAIYLLTIPLIEGPVLTHRLQSQFFTSANASHQLLGATAYASVVFVIQKSLIEAFDVSTGEVLDVADCDYTDNWVRGRYLWNSWPRPMSQWIAFSYNGSSIQFQQVPLGKYADMSSELMLFDRRGYDGAFAISTNRVSMLDLTHEVEVPLAGLWPKSSVLDIDSTGQRVLVGFEKFRENSAQVVETATRAISLAANARSLVQIDSGRFQAVPPQMKRFTRVFVGNEQGNEHLMLVSKGQICWFLDAQNNVLKLVQSSNRTSRLSRNLEPVKNSRVGVALHVAEWKDGSRIWIDGRGLLHLQSSDPLIPEATFVLNPTNVAVWTSDGQMMGQKYFVDRTSTEMSVNDVLHSILIPFVSRLQ